MSWGSTASPPRRAIVSAIRRPDTAVMLAATTGIVVPVPSAESSETSKRLAAAERDGTRKTSEYVRSWRGDSVMNRIHALSPIPRSPAALPIDCGAQSYLPSVEEGETRRVNEHPHDRRLRLRVEPVVGRGNVRAVQVRQELRRQVLVAGVREVRRRWRRVVRGQHLVQRRTAIRVVGPGLVDLEREGGAGD